MKYSFDAFWGFFLFLGTFGNRVWSVCLYVVDWMDVKALGEWMVLLHSCNSVYSSQHTNRWWCYDPSTWSWPIWTEMLKWWASRRSKSRRQCAYMLLTVPEWCGGVCCWHPTHVWVYLISCLCFATSYSPPVPGDIRYTTCAWWHLIFYLFLVAPYLGL